MVISVLTLGPCSGHVPGLLPRGSVTFRTLQLQIVFLPEGLNSQLLID